MRKHLNKLFTAVMLILTMVSGSMQVFAAEAGPLVETITLNDEMEWDYDMPVDLSWKTKQDKGQWIEELGIAQDATSLILVINNLDKGDPDEIPMAGQLLESDKKKSIAALHRLDGKSRMTYFSKGMDGEWAEVFSVDCYISGGGVFDKEETYGVYDPVSSFGSCENPGSLLPYRPLSTNDYWPLDPASEQYGSIFTVEKSYIKPERAVNLVGLKSYSNYGLILQPEDDYSSCPALIINCQQSETNNDLLSGIHMPQDNLRMMIQSIDQNTRFVIAGSLDDLETM